MKYVVKKKNKVFEVTNIDYPIEGYKFNTKNQDIKSLTLVNSKLINKVLDIKINNLFNRLLMIVNDAFNSDDNPSGVVIALDEIAMVKNTILSKYHKLLDEKKEEVYLKKLALLEQEMQDKLFYYQYRVVESTNKSR